jgi:hypothetical protein
LPSITTLTCDPDHVQVGHEAECKAVVTGEKIAPTGTVAFSSSGTGSFGTVSCNGGGSGDNANGVGGNDRGSGYTLTCSVKYTASQAGTQTIMGSYSGDATYSGSTGTFLLNSTNQGDQVVGLAVQPADQGVNATPAKYLNLYFHELNPMQTTFGGASSASSREFG